MFERMTAQWREARAAVIRPEVLDVISRYDRWGLYERYECLSAFDYFKRDFETENGPIDRWPEAMAKEATKTIVRAAKLGCTTAPYGASGAILLCFFVELHQIQGRLAEELRTLIAKWHATELQDDMPSASYCSAPDIGFPTALRCGMVGG